MPSFLKLFPCGCLQVCVCVFVYVCPPPRLLITSGMIGMKLSPYDWLKKFYRFYMVAIVGISSRGGLIIEALHRNQRNKSKLVLCKP